MMLRGSHSTISNIDQWKDSQNSLSARNSTTPLSQDRSLLLRSALVLQATFTMLQGSRLPSNLTSHNLSLMSQELLK